MKNLTTQEMFKRILRISPNACIRMRTAKGIDENSIWYVDIGDFIEGGKRGVSGNFLTHNGGSSPEGAIRQLWEKLSEDGCVGNQFNSFLLQYNDCKPKETIPGNGPQMWIQWNAEKDDWQNVEPTEDLLSIYKIPRDRVILYQSKVGMAA